MLEAIKNPYKKSNFFSLYNSHSPFFIFPSHVYVSLALLGNRSYPPARQKAGCIITVRQSNIFCIARWADTQPSVEWIEQIASFSRNYSPFVFVSATLYTPKMQSNLRDTAPAQESVKQGMYVTCWCSVPCVPWGKFMDSGSAAGAPVSLAQSPLTGPDSWLWKTVISQLCSAECLLSTVCYGRILSPALTCQLSLCGNK